LNNAFGYPSEDPATVRSFRRDLIIEL